MKRVSEDKVHDLVEACFDDAETAVLAELGESYTDREYDRAFNFYMRIKHPELAQDRRNFYKIFNKYGPQ